MWYTSTLKLVLTVHVCVCVCVLVMTSFYCMMDCIHPSLPAPSIHPCSFPYHPSLPLTEDVLCGGCGNGTCDTTTGKCECPTGFVGDHCSCKSSSLPLSVSLSLSLFLSLFLSLRHNGCICGVWCQSSLSTEILLFFCVGSFSSCLWLVHRSCSCCDVLCCISPLSVNWDVACLVCPVPVWFVLSLIGRPSFLSVEFSFSRNSCHVLSFIMFVCL